MTVDQALSGTYRIDASYEWNYQNGPLLADPFPKIPATPLKQFFGLPVASRLGISAGILLNSRWIEAYARLGFDILTYKTVRSQARPCQDLPNWLFVDPADVPHLAQQNRCVHAYTQPPEIAPQDITASVSFGMPSRAPKEWMADVARARSLLGRNQVLIVSVVASPQPGSGSDEVVRDFADLAAMAREAGAQIVEANLSCPNVRTAEGDIYNDAELSARVARAMRESAGDLPLLLKVGHMPDEARMAALLHAVAGQVDGLTMVNGLSRQVVDAAGAPAYGAGREKAGVLGSGVHELCLHQVASAVQLAAAERLDLQIVGNGGVTDADSARNYFDAGACGVLMGSAPMYDPSLAARIKAQHPEF
jgi:dihydroorotate dehydrogenase